MTWALILAALNAAAPIAAAMIVGGIGRYIYGGYLKWLPTQVAYLIFFALGVCLLSPAEWSGLRDFLTPSIVSFALAISWNPDHGSYADAGASPNKDDEDVRPLTRLVAAIFGATDNQSLLYDCCGMSVRYGLSTALTAIAMAGCNYWLSADFNVWYGVVGLSAGPMLAVLALLIKDVERRWTTFEIAIGALLYGALAAVV